MIETQAVQNVKYFQLFILLTCSPSSISDHFFFTYIRLWRGNFVASFTYVLYLFIYIYHHHYHHIYKLIESYFGVTGLK